MRFEISKVLDAIEGRVSTDPALARVVLDLAEVVRYVDLDGGGRPASLLRLGLTIDALGRRLDEDGVQVYAVAHRALLSDADLTSNERMVIRRWADDGLVEVLSNPADRVAEVADLLGLPVISRSRFEGWRDRYPWWAAQPGRVLTPIPGAGGPLLTALVGGVDVPIATTPASPAGRQVLGRLWRCPEPGCPLFGGGTSGSGAFADLAAPRTPRSLAAQPPPTLRTGVPTCPRHEKRLNEGGPRPPAQVLAVRIGGLVRQRFVVSADRAVLVGRAPEEPDGIRLGQWLNEEARRWISRNHLRLELRGADVVAQDMSTNGSGVRPAGSMVEADRRPLTQRQSWTLSPGDMIELYPGVHIGRVADLPSAATFAPGSVMAEAPTMAMRVVDHP